MAENERKMNKNNPFSFKSFVIQKETPSTVSSLPSEDIKDSGINDKPIEIAGKLEVDNPFSFTKFVKNDKSNSVSQEAQPTDDHLVISDDHFEDNRSPSEPARGAVLSETLDDILPDFSSEQPNEHNKSSRKQSCPSKKNTISKNDRLFDSDTEESGSEIEFKSKDDQDKEKSSKEKKLPLFDSSSDSDEFSPVPTKPSPQLFDDADDTHSVILEDLNGLTKAELIRKIELLREENNVLVLQSKTFEVNTAKQTVRVGALERELVAVRSKEAEDTAALEAAIQQVEASLRASKERGIEAEKSIKHLKQEVKSLQGSVKALQSENEQLKSRGGACAGAGPGASSEQLKFVSDQLNTAAVNAEQSLKQMLGGVESLKLMSQTLLSMDKFQELPSSPETS